MKIQYYTTGRKNGKEVYFPPLVKIQIESLTGFIEKYEVFIVNNLNFFSQFNNSKNKNFDLVHAQYGSITALTAWINSGRKPLIISFCGSDLEGTAGSGILWKIRDNITTNLSKWLALKADKVIVKSENLKNQLPQKAQVKAHLVPNGVDLKVFNPWDKVEARRKLGWGQKTKYILFTPSKANNQLVKNKPLALKTIQQVKSKTDDSIELVMLTNKHQTELAQMMNAADCLLLTSFHEGSPNVVKESMACNLPVVSVNVGDVSERLKKDGMSRVIDSYDASKLAENIMEIFAANKRSNGFEEIKRQNLDSDSVAERIVAIYQSMINA